MFFFTCSSNTGIYTSLPTLSLPDALPIFGLEVAVPDEDARFFYIPGCAAMPPDLAERLDGAKLLFFDGTLWHDDEMLRAGLGEKTGRRMGNMRVSGADGSMADLAPLALGRQV